MRATPPLVALLLPLALLLLLAHAAGDPPAGVRFEAGGDDDDDDDDAPAPARAIVDSAADGTAGGAVYAAPGCPEALFLETFTGKESRFAPFDKEWVHTEQEKFNGRFEVGVGKSPAIAGDRGLVVPEKAKFYGLAARFGEVVETGGDKDVVVQYELRMEEGLTCSGSYLKLIAAPFDKLAEWTDQVPYSVMFGPDKCGTDKLHFIVQSKNPKTGRFAEHHLKQGVASKAGDYLTHLYTLVVKADGGFDVLIDGESVAAGNLMEDFEPPIQPPEEIEDPEDFKPREWVDEAKIPDASAVKPDDWNEDEPREIPDESIRKPEAWEDNEPEYIPDPDSASAPEDWDEDEDGVWEPPMVPNPKCDAAGCGVWSPPMVPNPAYKGKWSPPLIDNPEYIGEWKPRKIPNPDYYKVELFHVLPMSGVGIDIWAMDYGIVFDNILVTHSPAAASTFAAQTFQVKRAAETKKRESSAAKSSNPMAKPLELLGKSLDAAESLLLPFEEALEKAGAGPMLDKLADAGIEKPILLIALIPPFLIALVLLCALGGRRATPAASAPAAVTPAATPAASETNSAVSSLVDAIEKKENNGEGVEAGEVKKRTKKAD